MPTRGGKLAAGLAAGLLLFFLFTGFLGLDFGVHWDEPYQTEVLSDCVRRLSPFPKSHIYHDLYFTLGLPMLLVRDGGLLRAALLAMARSTGTNQVRETLPAVAAFQQQAIESLRSQTQLLGTRAIFLVLSSLAIVWVYLAARRLHPRRPLPALAAAAFLALCWQFQFHARFIAVDALMAMFASLEFLLLAVAFSGPPSGRPPRSFWAAAAVAGLMLACKATGLFALLPIMVAPWSLSLEPRREIGRRIRWSLLGLITAFAVGLVFSPSVALDPAGYAATIRATQRDYLTSALEHPHYVSGFFEHIRRLFVWLLAVVPSHSVVPALGFSGLVVFGGIALFRRHRHLTVTWLCFVGAAILGMSTTKLLIVRNELVVIPFLAIAFGAGVEELHRRWPRTGARALLAAFVVGTFVANGAWMYTAGMSVRTTTRESIRAAVQHDLERHRQPIRVSPAVYELLRPTFDQNYVCTPASERGPRPKSVLLRFAEYDDPRWRANRLRFHQEVYSSWEVDYDWNSPAWIGRFPKQRIARISLRNARAIGLDMSSYWDCRPR